MPAQVLPDSIASLFSRPAEVDCLLNHLQDAVIVVRDGQFIYINSPAAEILGYAREEMLGRHFADFIDPQDRARIVKYHHARLSGDAAPERYEFRALAKDGQATPLLQNHVSMIPQGPFRGAVIGTVRDISRERDLQAALSQAHDALKGIIDNLPDVFYRTDAAGVITFVSPQVMQVFGYRPEEVIGTVLADYYVDADDRAHLLEVVRTGGGKPCRVNGRMRHRDGTSVWVASNVRMRLGPDGEFLGVEGLTRDESQRRELEMRLLELATTDELTGLANRRHFIERFQVEIERATRYGQRLTLMILDLDFFKVINDAYGHPIGDRALKAFADIVRERIRQTDFAGRLGGEEFAIALPQTNIDQALHLGDRLRHHVAERELDLGGLKLRLTVSVGLTEIEQADRSFADAFQRADRALYRAKDQGRNRVVFA